MSGALHGTVVALDGDGVVLRGPSGAGKSDTALRLLAEGWQVVADDRFLLEPRAGDLLATAPAALSGLLEVRGLGIIRLEPGQVCAVAPLRLVVELVGDPAMVERMPERDFFHHAGIRVPLIRLYPFRVSATAVLTLALAVARDPDKLVE